MNISELGSFFKEKKGNIRKLGEDFSLKRLGTDFIIKTAKYKYSYNFSWLGRPIIQMPQDIIALQELIWDVKPDLIIETGIAHGGSIIFSASMIALLEKCGCIDNGHVIAIDIDIRKHNRVEIEKHPLSKYITMIQGSSIDEEIVKRVGTLSAKYNNIMVSLDSNHTHEHVLAELEAYTPFISIGSYCVVFDTIIEDMPEDSFPDRPWGRGNNPKTAVRDFLKNHQEFEIDKEIEDKLLITVAPNGYLKRVK